MVESKPVDLCTLKMPEERDLKTWRKINVPATLKWLEGSQTAPGSDLEVRAYVNKLAVLDSAAWAKYSFSPHGLTGQAPRVRRHYQLRKFQNNGPDFTKPKVINHAKRD